MFTGVCKIRWDKALVCCYCNTGALVTGFTAVAVYVCGCILSQMGEVISFKINNGLKVSFHTFKSGRF